MDVNKKHALVIGGTGMLAGVCKWLVNEGYHVSVVARGSGRMQQLMSSCGDAITPLYVDYLDDRKLEECLRGSISKNGPVDVAVAWIHSIAENAVHTVANVLPETGGGCQLYQLFGSSTDLDAINRKMIFKGNNIYYRQIKLGFVLENGRSRWLTHDEISNGVIEAITGNRPVHTIGVLEPWEKRP